MKSLNDGTPAATIASISASTSGRRSATHMWKPKSTTARPTARPIQVSSASASDPPRACVA